jgi:crotonobetaine/carnitine-CoA ligase
VPCATRRPSALTQAIVCEPGTHAPDGVIGRPSVGYSVRILDENERLVKPGESGELRIRGIRGLSLFKEYDSNPAANEEAFDADGYFRTGDRVVLREDGWIAFGDRIKDVIKVGGEGVSSAEIEAVIARTGHVAEVAVVARPHDILGEIPVAFVVMAAGTGTEDARARLDEMMSACRERLSRFKVPRHIEIIEALPRVGFGKISKVRLREMAKELTIAPSERERSRPS